MKINFSGKEENKEMKRKVLSLMLALCMVFGLMVNANATVRSVTGQEAPTVSKATTSSGKEIKSTDIKVSAPKDTSKLSEKAAATLNKVTEALTSTTSTKEFFEKVSMPAAVQESVATAVKTAVAAAVQKAVSAGVSAEKVAALENVDVEDLVPAATFAIEVSDEIADLLAAGESVELTLDVAGVTEDDIVLALVDDGTDWHVFPGTAGNGTVTADFTALGTVVIMQADGEADSGLVTSPQTSGANLEGVILVCGAVLSLAVVLLCMKRSRMAA